HTVEGGAVAIRDPEVDQRLFLQGKFGHLGDEHFMLGINAKMSEVHAAMGMAVLPHVESLISKRKAVASWYDDQIIGKVTKPTLPQQTEYNYAYYAIQLANGEQRSAIAHAMETHNIHPRRYFYP